MPCQKIFFASIAATVIHSTGPQAKQEVKEDYKQFLKDYYG
jgi:hypothetical protein